MTRVYRYVPLRHVERYLAAGWIDCGALVGTHHGLHAEIMRAPMCWNPEATVDAR